MAAVPRAVGARGVGDRHAADEVVHHDQRRVERRRAGARVVVADRVGRPGHPDVRGRQPASSSSRRRASTATTTSRSCRSRGSPTSRSWRSCASAISSRRRKPAICSSWSTASTSRPGSCGGSSRRTRGRRSADATARTPTPRRRRPPTASASTRCSATSGCSATRWTASCCGRTRLTPQPRYLDFGTAASPVVHDGRVYFQDDNEIELVPRRARREDRDASIWTTKRTVGGGRPLSGWSSPYVWVNAKRTEIVTIGRQFAVSYDLDGKELWRLKGLTQANPTPTEGDGLLYIGTGSQGEANRPLFAVKPGASGDISLQAGRDVQRVRRVVPAARRGLHLVAAGVRRPRLRGQRHRHPAGVRREDRQARSTRRASAASATRSPRRRGRSAGRSTS